MKKEWKTLLAVFGIALLSAAVALMPACDTSESCDLDLESLAGDWQMTITPEEGDISEPIVTFTISGDTLTVEEEGKAPQVFNLDCGGDRVTLSLSDTVPLDAIGGGLFAGYDCTVTATQTIRVTFSPPDDFAGTQTQSVTSLSGLNCAEIEIFFKLLLGNDMAMTAEVAGTRIIN